MSKHPGYNYQETISGQIGGNYGSRDYVSIGAQKDSSNVFPYGCKWGCYR